MNARTFDDLTRLEGSVLADPIMRVLMGVAAFAWLAFGVASRVRDGQSWYAAVGVEVLWLAAASVALVAVVVAAAPFDRLYDRTRIVTVVDASGSPRRVLEKRRQGWPTERVDITAVTLARRLESSTPQYGELIELCATSADDRDSGLVVATLSSRDLVHTGWRPRWERRRAAQLREDLLASGVHVIGYDTTAHQWARTEGPTALHGDGPEGSRSH